VGILAPLYLAGLAALGLPLILHLVRRTPRGRQDFSSLMFLAPSPPRLTRRSRLDQIVLLLLRLAALALLAFAFARPFLRESATLALEDLPARRVAIAVDTSASMRRGDLWQQAMRQVERELSDLGAHDEVALFTFNDRLQTVVDFEAGSAEAAASQVDIIRQAVAKLRPTFGGADLGAALTAVAAELDAASDVKQLPAEPQIIAISDFSRGSRLDALQAFEWPGKVRLIARQLSPKRTTNAALQLVTSEEDAADAEPRVRVTSAADSQDDQFFVSWTKEGVFAKAASETGVYVPPGQSRVIKVPRPENLLDADRIVLRGDDHDFDNTFYVAPPRKQDVQVLYAGSDAADDQQGPLYYFKLATAGDPLRQVEVQSLESDDAAKLSGDPAPPIAVVTRKVSAAFASALKTYVEQGGTLVLAPRDREAAAVATTLLGDVEVAEGQKSSESAEYLLLGEIDFTHPLFVPFANPRYSDFTKIHFWKQRPLKLKDNAATRAVAKFDNGAPAILEQTLGKGRVLLFASGWHPEDSQLALSTKFVPLVAAIIDQACGTSEGLAGVTVGEPAALPSRERFAFTTVHKPDGSEARLAEGATAFDQTDQPGVYQLGAGDSAAQFAVNLASAESNTAPLALEQLEQLGVRLGAVPPKAERLDRIRQQRDTELESRQKIWRWLIVGALGLLIAETWWAGRATRQIEQSKESAA
jgi:hypothetical protein